MSSVDRTSPQQNGPPLGVLAVVSTVLFVGGLVISTVMSGGHPYPSPFGDATEILEYFREQSAAVRVSGFSQFAAAVPLGIYAATASARLRNLGVRAPGATIALAGGVVAAAMLALSGLLTWVLSRPEVVTEPSLVRALHDLAFATGGVGNVVFFGLLLAGMAVPGLMLRLLPRPLAWAGLALAAIAEITTLTLLVPAVAYLLPVARFAGLAWLIAAGFRLPHARATGRPPTSDVSP
jgi:hypothetical protein